MELVHSIQVRAEDAGEVALAIARRFRTLGWKVVRDPKGRGAPASSGDPDGLRRFLISPSERGWVTILPSGAPDAGPDSLVAFLARDLDTVALWFERVRRGATETGSGEPDERLAYEIYWKNKRIDRQDMPEAESGKAPSAYPTLIDGDLQSLGFFMPAGTKHPKLTVAELPRHYPKYAGEKAYLGRFAKIVTAADYPMLWCTYSRVWEPEAPEMERLETWGHLGFQKEDGRSAAARLTHGDPAARRGAVEALASCAADEARPGLQAALADDDAEVRLAAATVVAARPDRGLAQDLADRLADEDVRVRAAAARALRDMGVKETAEALMEVALEDEVEVRRAAIAALAHVDGDAKVRQTLAAAARKDKDAEVRRWAAEGLGAAPMAEVQAELVKLLADKDAAVRAAAARAAARAGAAMPAETDPKKTAKLVSKLVEAVRKVASKDPDEETRADAIRALRALAPDDKEAIDLAMKLAAQHVKAGDLKDLAVRLPRGEAYPNRDKRIAAALHKRVEKEPTAEAIVALGNQADEKLFDAMKDLVHKLWAKSPEEEGISRAVLGSLAEARAAIPYALSRLDDAAALPLLLKILDLEQHRTAPEDAARAAAEDHWRIETVFGATEAILALLPKLKPEAVEKVKEKFTGWLGAPGVTLDAAGAAMRRAALLAFGAPITSIASGADLAPVPAVAPAVAVPVKVGKKGTVVAASSASTTTPASSKAVSPMTAPALPNKPIVGIVRGLLADIRWPEAAAVLARQFGPKAAPVLANALGKGIDKEVRLARKGGYSKRDAELVGAQRRGILLALRELKDTSVVPAIVRLLALESIRAGKVERKTETSLLGITVSTLQALTGYKFGAEPQRWQEVATGKLPLVAEPPKKAAAPALAKKAGGTVTKLPVKKAAAKKPATKSKAPAKAKPAAKAKKSAKPAAKAKPKKAAKVAKAKKPLKAKGAKKAPVRKAAKSASAKKGGLRSLVVRAVKFARTGARKVSAPRRMAAYSARSNAR